MKKIISLTMAFAFLFTLASCGIKNASQESSATITAQSTESASERSETTTKNDIIKEYVKGIKFLEKKPYDLFVENNFARENQTSKVDKSSEGYIGYYIYDFDKDNENELLLISHKFEKPACKDMSNSYEDDYCAETESYVCAEMYDVDSDKVVKKDEIILFTTGESTDGYSDLIVFNYKDTVQIGFGRSRNGFFGSGQDTGFCAVKYNGSQFEEVMKEYWAGSGDLDMFQNILDKLYEMYGISEEKVIHGKRFETFQSSEWMTECFDIVDKVLCISINPYQDSSKLEYFDGQDTISFKISWT